MDTILLKRSSIEKLAASAAGFGIAICLMISQNTTLSAKDVGNLTGISPRLNYIQEEQQLREVLFEDEILNKYKYRNVSITDVEKGVKYVRMIKYYNNRPVRINIVELSLGVNDSLKVEPSIASAILASRTKIANIADKNKSLFSINCF